MNGNQPKRRVRAVLWGLGTVGVCLALAQFLLYFTGLSGSRRLLLVALVGLCSGLLAWATDKVRCERAAQRQATAAAAAEQRADGPAAASAHAGESANAAESSSPAARAAGDAPPPTRDPAVLAEACGKVATGYLFLYLNFNLNFGGTLDVLPDWLGMVFLLQSLPALACWQPAALLLQPLGLLLAGWEGLEWLTAIFQLDLAALPVLPLVVRVVSLYFHFQLLTNLADAVQPYHPEEADALRGRRTLNTLFLTAFALPLPWEEWQYAALVLLLCSVAVTFALWHCLRRIRRLLLAADAAG